MSQAATSAGQSGAVALDGFAPPPERATALKPLSRPAAWSDRAPVSPAMLAKLADQRELLRARFAASSVTADTAPRTPERSVTKPPAAPLGFTPAYSIYLPVATNQSLGLHGNVTLNGAPAAGITVELRFYNGVVNSTAATTTTDAVGQYAFPGRAGLSAGQQYWIRYRNTQGQTDRLSSWVTQYITAYAAGADYSFGVFDIADVRLGSPAPYEVIAPPTVFTWTGRTATPTDSYEIDVFDPGGVDPSYSTGALGYISATTIVSMPAGLSLLKVYGWALGIESPNGGFGTSYYYNPFLFGKAAGIQGRVTESGVNTAGITVTLVREEAGVPTDLSTVTTGPDGIYQITSAPTLNAGQQYYVRYGKNITVTSRLYAWYTAYITSFKAGQRAYAGNIDIANVFLTSPNFNNGSGSLPPPYTFRWTPRPSTLTDSYCVQVFTLPDPNLHFYTSTPAGYVDNLSLNSIPSNFSAGPIYGWNSCIVSPDNGIGVSYQYFMFIFQ
ncbi:MAG: hypothetical protein M1434_01560 [Chloroflexi bacterium]|nr:hypothetical protein [Chloroflexota bacterium]MCL5273415.1 hypothetical protein [Chloroflexota bacterium]